MSQHEDSFQDVNPCASQLAAAIGRGDEKAFDHFYDLFHPRVVAFALRLHAGNPHLAEELAQQVMITAATKLRSIDSEAHLWNWLALVTRRHFSKYLRTHLRSDSCMEELRSERAVEGQISVDTDRLEAALCRLPEDEQVLIKKYYYENLSQRELAAFRQVTTKAIERQLERIRAKLRKWIIKEPQQ